MKKVNVKEKKFIKGIVNGDSQVDAYQKAYKTAKSRRTAVQSASKKMAQPHIKNMLEKTLRDQGIDEKAIGETMLQLKRDRSWKAKDAFINHAKEMLGYKNTPQQQMNFQQNIYNKRDEFDI